MDLSPNPRHENEEPASERYAQDVHRSLPASHEAEQGILCSIFLKPLTSLDEAALRIQPEFFHNLAHRFLYVTMQEMADRQEPIDLITVTENVMAANRLESVGGPAYLAELQTAIPTAANLSFYLEILREKYILRRAIKIGGEMTRRAYDSQDEIDELIDAAEREITDLSQSRFQKVEVNFKDLIFKAIENIEDLYDRKGALTGVGTGLIDLDRLTGGLQPGDMITIAARPSMGKSALGMNIIEHAAVELGHAAGVFSLEMSASQLVQRLLCSRARVNLQRVRDGFLSERDFPNLTRAAGELRDSTILIDDTSKLSIAELRAKARRWKAKFDIKILLIDYLQLVSGSTRRSEDDRRLEVAEVSSGIKALAKELDIPIVAIAQLNRKSEDRAGGRPRLGDLREAGDIEQDSDVVGLIYRPEYYAKDDEEKIDAAGEAELIVAKQRMGPIGTVQLTFLKQYARFENHRGNPKPDELF